MTQHNQLKSDQVQLRPVLIWQDVVLLSRLARQIWLEHYTPIIGRDQVDYMTAKYQSVPAIWRDMHSNGMMYDLIVCDNQLAGYIAVKTDAQQKKMFLSKFYVDRSRRGQGLGRWAFRQLIDRARSDECRVIWLTVNRYNAGSIAAYQKLGFHIAKEICTDIGDGFVMDDYLMEYPLS